MLASAHTYSDPKIVARNLATLDRMLAEDTAWHRVPFWMRKPGYFAGVDAVIIYRKGELTPVPLGELTALELDRLLTVPALTAQVA